MPETMTKEQLEQLGYIMPRLLPTGEWAGLHPMMFTTGLCIIDAPLSIKTRWCYEMFHQAVLALADWDGQGHPPGMWIKQKPEDLLNPEWARAHPEQAIDAKLTDTRKITTVTDVSHVAICDSCNEHYYADSPDEGGWLFGSHADCPKCATPEREKRIAEYGETHLIVTRALPGERYFDFVMRVRAGNHSIVVTAPADDPMHDIVKRNAAPPDTVFFDGTVQATSYHNGWRPLKAFYVDAGPYAEDHVDELSRTVPAPADNGKPGGPDSIIILAMPKE